MAESLRRSGRQRKRNPRYSYDVIDDEDELKDTQPENDSEGSAFEHNDEDGEDDEAGSLPASSENGTSPNADFEHGEASDDDLLPMDIEIVARPSATPIGKRTKKTPVVSPQKRSRKYAGHRNDGLRNRGLHLHSSVMSKDITIGEMSGYDPALREVLLIERSKYDATKTLPYRETRGPGQSGLCYPEVFEESIRHRETQCFLGWYRHGKHLMDEMQAITILDEASARPYLDMDRAPQNILIGPYQAQHAFTLNHLDGLSVAQAWNVAIRNHAHADTFDETSTDRKAWILNMGSRILAMDWAPNQSDRYQFLAVAVNRNNPPHILKVSALEPSETFKSAVQIWAFETRKHGSSVVMDLDAKPRLGHVLCAEWGLVRRLSWCPVATSTVEKPNSIGILGLVTTDGCIRVVDVVVNLTSGPHVEYKSAAFTSRPPNTIFTCLTWLSGNILAAGCANGHVAIWDIAHAFQAQIDKRGRSENPDSCIAPYWYHPLHATYVLSIVGHQPFPCEYITTNSVDGKVRLTSIRHPYPDTCYGSRERHVMPPLVYSPHILGIYEIDESDGLRARPLRHMPVSRAVGKASAQVVCVDVGKVHPTLLFGSSDGRVTITNPIRRMFIRRVIDERIETWQQTWFQHEFIPASRAMSADYETSLQNETHQQTHIHPRPGVSRFLESFKLETVALIRSAPSAKEGKSKTKMNGSEDADIEAPATPSGRKQNSTTQNHRQDTEAAKGLDDIQISIYEEEQAVTCLSWNPNVQTGGWAAAGLANGLIRIEDLAV